MLQHVSVEVRPEQVDACVAFWALLGFEQVTPPGELAERFTWVEREGTQIHLMPFEEPSTRCGHLAVVVEDPEPVLGSLRERGFELRRARTPGARRAGSPAIRRATTSS